MKIRNGLIEELSYSGFTFPFTDDIFIQTKCKSYAFSKMQFTLENGVYICRTEDAEFSVRYKKVENTSFFNRSISVKFKNEAILTKISVSAPKECEGFMYDTFFNASAAAFFRCGDVGMCCGFENPYCKLSDGLLFFEPSIVLKKNELFECDLNFYGIYELQGELIRPELKKSQICVNGRYQPRYRNPSEGIPLYFSEIRRFGEYTENYFECSKKEFKFMVYDFFGNLPQRPSTEEEFNAYLEHIDACVAIGCDTILLNPLYPNKIPDASPESFWELFPENTDAKKIFDYAKSKGLKVGIYTGTAGNGIYGNSSMIPYADNSQWKKIDVCGHISSENCIADDDFVEWYIEVQKNTIKKYGLDLWSWDPGPGNGFFCHSEKHGHLPGKGQYKGFRNSLKVMAALKKAFPDLYYQGFHGNKEYGLWGFKYIDQHEAYWENEVYVMNPIFDDLSVDRATANNIRLQSTWNYYFRFMPTVLNHGISNRMIQANWMNMLELDSVFDYTGFKYALLSSIAYGGSITLTILPRKPESIKGFTEFYKRWIPFAKENFHVPSIPFGHQVGCGIDAVSKLKDDQGYIFLFNPFPEDHEFKFALDSRIGLSDENVTYYTDMIYPHRKALGNSAYGESIRAVIPAYECVVLEISKSERESINDCVLPALPRALTADSEHGYSFFAGNEIRKLLDKFAVSEKAIAVQQAYSEKFNRVNSCWSRPDRLWLFVKATRAEDDCFIKVNGKAVDWKQDFLAHNELNEKGMVFADITDEILWLKNNGIELHGFDETAVYLSYPRCENEQIPPVAKECNKVKYYAPLLSDDVKILSAKVNKDNIIIPDTENTVEVQVNLPYDALEGVYASVPISIGETGYELKRDMALEYRNGVWFKKFRSGKRIHLIIDDCKLSVWAVTKDQKESRTYCLPIEWKLDSDSL